MCSSGVNCHDIGMIASICCKAVQYHHYSDVMASQITGVSIVYSTICSGADQRKHQSSASLAFVRGIHPWPVNSPHRGPVTRKMFPFDEVIMIVTSRYRYTVGNEVHCICNHGEIHFCFISTKMGQILKITNTRTKPESVILKLASV